ncbi:type VI secretion system Vgr family protein [Chitinophaga arvensicola]|uniref:Uncharacterized conserved protein, implicated in type VI secretion and phage assembly n=1 Tax=Chitinophaga arvensicola TaxID=29529 RepID=A0A1I0Q2R9_9BACT|nr:phage baseplate assembly protein V [Chitinophaga arvensicola]SEW21266.1 Uncharacterized conserved protein, implicated in type VI secretion and phage assembly [Chitinophaga arvensicola]
MALNTTTTISVEQQQFDQFRYLHLKQSTRKHHEFELGISYDWLSRYGEHPVKAGKYMLGKEISISIRPAEINLDMRPLLFNGIITGVSAGKEADGNTGECILKGNCPAILLSGNPHMQSYEQQTLSSIVNTVFKNCHPFAASPLVDPSHTDPLKYIVQYKEPGFDFLHRLSQRYGENFFYNGQQLIFGKYLPQKTSLVHQKDLIDFAMEYKTRPLNQTLQTYEYRRDQHLEGHTKQLASNYGNTYTLHMQALSNKMYPHKASYKVPFAFSSKASAELFTLTHQFHKSRAAELVTIKGSSRNTGLRVGDIVSIQEQISVPVDHGEFLLTSIEHFCNGNGHYHNTFEGIPADMNANVLHRSDMPVCEAQRAIVTDNNDPKGLGRIRVRYQWQQGSTPWIRLHQPHAGAGKGFYFIPEINEEVWTDFEGGNPEAPYAIGCAYNGNATTSYGDPLNNIKAIKTRSGHTIRLDDTEGKENIIITDKGGNTVLMDTYAKSISISAPEKINITARNISIHASENVDLNAGSNVNHAAGIDILQHAGDSLYQYAVNDYRLTATNITKIALENMSLQAKEIDKNAEEINIESTKENMQISAGKSVSIKSSEKSKIF